MQELTERSVSGSASGCTYSLPVLKICRIRNREKPESDHGRNLAVTLL